MTINQYDLAQMGAVGFILVMIFLIILMVNLIRVLWRAPGHMRRTEKLLEEIRDALKPPRS